MEFRDKHRGEKKQEKRLKKVWKTRGKKHTSPSNDEWLGETNPLANPGVYLSVYLLFTLSFFLPSLVSIYHSTCNNFPCLHASILTQ